MVHLFQWLLQVICKVLGMIDGIIHGWSSKVNWNPKTLLRLLWCPWILKWIRSKADVPILRFLHCVVNLWLSFCSSFARTIVSGWYAATFSFYPLWFISAFQNRDTKSVSHHRHIIWQSIFTATSCQNTTASSSAVLCLVLVGTIQTSDPMQHLSIEGNWTFVQWQGPIKSIAIETPAGLELARGALGPAWRMVGDLFLRRLHTRDIQAPGPFTCLASNMHFGGCDTCPTPKWPNESLGHLKRLSRMSITFGIVERSPYHNRLALPPFMTLSPHYKFHLKVSGLWFLSKMLRSAVRSAIV